MQGRAWDAMAREYDGCVGGSPDPVVSGFAAEEIRVAASLCRAVMRPGRRYAVLDVGSGTGRVLFGLRAALGDSASYAGVDSSQEMVRLARAAARRRGQDASFHLGDAAGPGLEGLLGGRAGIVTCMYNTIGVVPAHRRAGLVAGMRRLAGPGGLAVVSAFNGDEFASVAPRMYGPMRRMVGRIGPGSFDARRLAFRNSLGYHSQWFTLRQLLDMMGPGAAARPVRVRVDGVPRTLGHVVADRAVPGLAGA